MTTAARVWTALGVLVVVTVVGWALLAGMAVVLGGVITVEIVDADDGLSLYLPVPVAVVDAVVASLGAPAVHGAGFGVTRGVGPELDLGDLGPVVLDVLDQLEALPDAVLVEVVDGAGRVRVAKSGGDLVIEVAEPGSSVTVAIPARGARRLAGRLLG